MNCSLFASLPLGGQRPRSIPQQHPWSWYGAGLALANLKLANAIYLRRVNPHYNATLSPRIHDRLQVCFAKLVLRKTPLLPGSCSVAAFLWGSSVFLNCKDVIGWMVGVQSGHMLQLCWKSG